jgi:hypothetical protein
MYQLKTDALGLKDGHVVYGETKQEVIAKMFQYLEMRHAEYVGQPTIQRLAELDAAMNLHIEEIPE